jgi:hypothetical protein
MGSISASSDTVEFEGAADEAVLNTVHREKNPKIPLFKSANTVFLCKRKTLPRYRSCSKMEKVDQNFRVADRGKDPRVYLVSFLDKFVELGLEDTLQFVHDVG